MWWRLVRFGFRLLYHELAFSYDLVANVVSLGQWWTWQRTALEFLPTDGLILELAHGTGHLQSDLLRGGWQALGCDLSPQMGRLARHRLQRQQLPIRLFRSDAQALPIPDHSLAGMICTFPTPFFLEPHTLREVRRVLRADGRLVIIPNAILTKGGFAKEALELAYQATGQRGTWSVDIVTHFAQFGLHLQIHTRELPRSTVVVLVASVPNE